MEAQPEGDEQAEAEKHAALDEPLTARQADGQALHELLPCPREKACDGQECDRDGSRGSYDSRDPMRPIDDDRPRPGHREPQRNRERDEKPRQERARERHPELGGDQSGGGEWPRGREGRQPVGIDAARIRPADRHGDERGHEGRGEQHGGQHEEAKDRRLMADEKGERVAGRHPAHHRGARSRHTRHERQRLTHADGERAGVRHLFDVAHDRRGAQPFDEEHHDAARDERDGKHARAGVEDALDEGRQQRARDERRDGCKDDRRGEIPGVRVRAEAEDHLGPSATPIPFLAASISRRISRIAGSSPTKIASPIRK